MNELYYDVTNPASYGGIGPLARESKNGLRAVTNWLKTQDTYSLHKPIRKKFERRKTFAKGIGDLFQADLVDMQSLSRFNDSYRYILTCIDVFSKKAFALPLKNKSGTTLVAALEKIFLDTTPNMLQTDRGMEFLNHQVQDLLKKYNIHHYWSFNDDIKAACVERYNRSLKTRMYRYFTAHHTKRWIDVLQALVDSYNKSFHRTIGMAPNDVTSENSRQIAERMYPPKVPPIWKFQIGDLVRITRYKHVFVKGYIQNWTMELFVIAVRYATTPVTYGLKDLTGEEIKGRFYEQELQKVIKTDNEYIIEKVLRTRKETDKSNTLSSGKDMPTSSTVGRRTYTQSNVWVTCCGRVHKDQVVFLCQVVIAYIVIITSFINITISSENTCLWATLASGTIGYLLPSPSFTHDPVSRRCTSV